MEFVGEPTYEIVSVKGGWSYNITVKIKNVGDVVSEEIVVNLTDEALDFPTSLKKYVTIEPGKTETIYFEGATIYDYDQTMYLSYYPADLGKVWTEKNHEVITFELIIEDEDTNTGAGTPGFEILLFFLAISLVYMLKKKK